MDPQEYNIGTKNSKIKLHITVSIGMGTLITPDIAVYMDSAQRPDPEPNSTDTDYYYILGNAKDLDYGLLKAEFTFDLKMVSPSNWNDCFDNLEITYTLSGGKASQTFSHLPTDTKNKSTSGQLIITKKEFLLTT